MAVFGEGVEEAALCSYCVGGREETDMLSKGARFRSWGCG